jgi:hypothetical protein
VLLAIGTLGGEKRRLRTNVEALEPRGMRQTSRRDAGSDPRN